MSKAHRVIWFSLAFVTILFGWTGTTFSGAPAPAPVTGGPHPEHQIANLGDFEFENGQVVHDFKVSYVTHGELNEKEDNVILVMQAFTQDHHGSDFMIGPGKALDTDKYFIVATDFVGNARLRHDLTTGPTNSGLKMAFPRYTIRDSVDVEYRFLTEYLGFDRILAAIGASVGAMKAYQIAVSYPDFVQGIIPIAGSPVINFQTRAMLRSMADDIALDNGWYGGNYERNPAEGVNIALMNIVPWWYSARWFATNVKTEAQYLQFAKFWHDVWSIFAPQDARDVYYQIHAWADYDIGDTPGFDGNAEAALGAIEAQVLLIGFKHDMLVTPDELLFTKDSIPNVAYRQIDVGMGHIAGAGFDSEATEIMSREITQFLAELR